MVTERDMKVFEFIRCTQVATTQQIHKALFSGVSKTIVSRSLNKLLDYGYIKRKTLRKIIKDNQYGAEPGVPMSVALQLGKKDLVTLSEGTCIYYVDKLPCASMLVHELVGTNLVASFYSEGVQIEVVRNKRIGTIVPDMYIRFTEGSLLFVEIQNITNPTKNCTAKYRKFLENKEWHSFCAEVPEILVVSKDNPGEPFSWCNIHSILI